MPLFFQQLDMAQLKTLHAWTVASTTQPSVSDRKQLVDALLLHVSQVTFCMESYVPPMPSSANITCIVELSVTACSIKILLYIAYVTLLPTFAYCLLQQCIPVLPQSDGISLLP